MSDSVPEQGAESDVARLAADVAAGRVQDYLSAQLRNPAVKLLAVLFPLGIAIAGSRIRIEKGLMAGWLDEADLLVALCTSVFLSLLDFRRVSRSRTLIYMAALGGFAIFVSIVPEMLPRLAGMMLGVPVLKELPLRSFLVISLFVTLQPPSPRSGNFGSLPVAA